MCRRESICVPVSLRELPVFPDYLIRSGSAPGKSGFKRSPVKSEHGSNELAAWYGELGVIALGLQLANLSGYGRTISGNYGNFIVLVSL